MASTGGRQADQLCAYVQLLIKTKFQNPRPTLGVKGLFTAPCVATRLTAEVTGLFTAAPSSAALAIL